VSKRYGGRHPAETPKERLTADPAEIMARTPLLQALRQMEPAWEGERGPWLGRTYHAPTPLPVRPPIEGERDFTGLRFDRLTVIGHVDEPGRKNGARWLVRCDCGTYETRRTPALAGRMRADRASCQRCDYLLHLKKREFFDRHGRWPEDQPVKVPTVPANPAPDKGHRGKGDRTNQRRRLKARLRAERLAKLKLLPAGRIRPAP